MQLSAFTGRTAMETGHGGNMSGLSQKQLTCAKAHKSIRGWVFWESWQKELSSDEDREQGNDSFDEARGAENLV